MEMPDGERPEKPEDMTIPEGFEPPEGMENMTPPDNMGERPEKPEGFEPPEGMEDMTHTEGMMGGKGPMNGTQNMENLSTTFTIKKGENQIIVVSEENIKAE